MRRLIAEHPDGLAGFKGDLTPTKLLNAISVSKTGRSGVDHSEASDVTKDELKTGPVWRWVFLYSVCWVIVLFFALFDRTEYCADSECTDSRGWIKTCLCGSTIVASIVFWRSQYIG